MCGSLSRAHALITRGLITPIAQISLGRASAAKSRHRVLVGLPRPCIVQGMDFIAVGFWGAFLGCAAMSVVVSILAFSRSARRVAIRGSVAALLSAGYAVVFLGWVPGIGGDALQRLRAMTAIVSAAVLVMFLFLLLGAFRKGPWSKVGPALVGALALLTFALCVVLPPPAALRLALAAGAVAAAGALVASVLSARRGERVGWLAVAALPCLGVAMAGLDFHVLHADGVPWQVHALSATTAMGYLLCIGTAMWTRYAYLLEVRKAMTYGPNYDPVSGLPIHGPGAPPSEFLAGSEERPIGLIVISIGNLPMLEELHGRGAYNHAIFACATRLRSLALAGVELARLQDEGFLLVARRPESGHQLIDQARQVVKRLSRPVLLGTSREAPDLERGGAVWEALLGVGVLLTNEACLESSVAGARDISRSAFAFRSRMAWYDEAEGAIAEIPLSD